MAPSRLRARSDYQVRETETDRAAPAQRVRTTTVSLARRADLSRRLTADESGSGRVLMPAALVPRDSLAVGPRRPVMIQALIWQALAQNTFTYSPCASAKPSERRTTRTERTTNDDAGEARVRPARFTATTIQT